MPYRYPSAIWACSQVHSQVVPPSSVKIIPKLVARTIWSGRSAGSKIPYDWGKAPLPRAGPAQASSATRTTPAAQLECLQPFAPRAGALSCQDAASLVPPMLTIAFDTFVLANGLPVILHVDRSSPLVAVDVWYHVGSKDESPGRTGFAHLFEHLMFMGSRNAPYPAFDAIMESWGGHNNGTTSNDRTNYYEIGPRNLLETFLWLEADRLATLSEVITDEELERQRKVVQNERRQSYENRPYGRAELAIPEAMYPPEHPYHWPTIGSHADVEAATWWGFLGAGHRTDATSFLQDLPTTWTRLHRLAGIGDFNSANARANVTWEMGRLVAEYALERGSSLRGRLVYLQSARCRIAALDFVGSSTNPGLTELLDGLETDLDLVAQTPFLPGG